MKQIQKWKKELESRLADSAIDVGNVGEKHEELEVEPKITKEHNTKVNDCALQLIKLL